MLRVITVTSTLLGLRLAASATAAGERARASVSAQPSARRVQEAMTLQRKGDVKVALLAVRLVSLLHRLLEAGLGGALRERVALGRVARDAVEEDAEGLCGLEPLRVERLVHEQLHHHQLVHRRERDPLEQCLEALLELGCRRGLDGKSPLERSAT